MKINEVPQDNDGVLKEGKARDLCYAVDENGEYKTKFSVGWDPKHQAMMQAWDKINEDAEEIRKDVLSGKSSPILYYMHKNVMDVPTLAGYVGLWTWRVKRHFKQKAFEALPNRILQKYAATFSISVEELKDISRLSQK